MREDEARKIEDAVAAHGPFDSIEALRRVSKVKARTLRVLAKADAFGSMGLDRQSALWHVRKLRDDDLPLFDQHEPAGDQLEVTLPQVEPSQKVLYDYASTGLSLKAHPVSFLRAELDRFGVTRNGALKDESAWPHGRPIAVAGQVLVRQRPGTASGVVFMTIEDETGVANLIVRPKVYKRFRKAARHSVIMLARGWVERKGKVVHVMVRKIEDFGRRRQALSAKARNFH